MDRTSAISLWLSPLSSSNATSFSAGGYRTGQAGGSLVYEHGAAQAYSAGARAAPSAHDDD
jgi:hypothetical protein